MYCALAHEYLHVPFIFYRFIVDPKKGDITNCYPNMFAESYNPYSVKIPLSPRSHEQRKKREKARQRRLVETELRRQAEMEQMQRIEDEMQDSNLKLDQIMNQHNDDEEEQEELRQWRLQLLSRRDDDRMSTALPFLPTLSNIDTRDELEDELLDYHHQHHRHQDSIACPPRLVLLKSDGQPNTRTSYQHATRRKTDPGVCTDHNHTVHHNNKQDGAEAIDNQEKQPTTKNYDYGMNHESRASIVSIATATPHIIAEESDDEEDYDEEEDLNLMWMNLGSAIAPNRSFP